MLGFLGKALKVIGGIVAPGTEAAGAVETVKKIISTNALAQEKVQALEIEEKKIILEELRTTHALYAKELSTTDPFVRRARPAGLWLVFAVLALHFVVIPLLNTIATYFGHDPVVMTLPEIPETVAWLMGSIFALYSGARSWDKRTEAKKGGQ